MEEIDTIRKALTYSFRLGVYSQLDYYTELQSNALKALSALESSSKASTSPPRSFDIEVVAQASPAACTWPREEGCDT